MGGNGHDLLLAAVGIVSAAERDAIVFEGHEAMVGDGDAVSVAGQVVENVFGAAEGRLGVNDPVLLAELPEEVVESSG
jgi:sensor domain CHASE-containing protein